MIACASCGQENPAYAKFCLACGRELVTAAPREERRVVSVIFVDLVGFTQQSDQRDPEDVRAILGPYHTCARREIESFVGRALQRRVRFGRQLARRHVALPTLEPQQLRLLVGHDVEDDAI